MSHLLVRLRAADLDRGPTKGLTVAEAVLGAAVVFIAVVGWLALALATVGEFRRVTLLVAVTLAVAAAGWLIRAFPPPPIVFDRGDWVVLGVTILAAVFFLPGAEYLFADKDPGVYSSHAFAIARTGSTEIPDPITERLHDQFAIDSPLGGRFAGYWYTADRRSSLPQFFHMFPSLLAAAKITFGAGAVLQLPAAIAVLSAATFTAAARRVFGPLVAAVGGTLIATNMLSVFFAKYPTTEPFAQLLYGGAALLLITAMRTRWAPAAVGAGMLLTFTFLNRPDGVFLMLLGVAALALGIAVRIDRRLLIGGAVGLAIPVASVWWQTYERNAGYARVNGVPADRVVGVVIVAMLVGGLVVRRFAPDLLDSLIPHRTRQRQVIAIASLAVVGAWIAFSALRPRLLGANIQVSNGRQFDTLDDVNLRRLFFFFSPAGLVLFWVGVTIVLVVHRRAASWVLLGPGMALLPVYIWRARISPRLMWWGRRFVPTAVPALALIIAVAAVWLIVRRGWHERLFRAAALGALTVVLGLQLYQSSRLIGFREFEGSDSFLTQVNELAGADDAVFVWEQARTIVDPARIAAGPMWFIYDRPSAVLPADPSQDQLDEIADAFDGYRVFVLTHNVELPAGLDPSRLRPAGLIASDVEQWQEAFRTVPLAPNVSRTTVTAWELTE